MIVTNIIQVSFDPVKEYSAMTAFEKAHPDWEKSECTVDVTFEKKDVSIYEAKEG